MQSFLINDLQNNAGDPDPFKVKTEALHELGKSAIGRPWILPPKNEPMHVIGKEREFEAILEYQKAFAGGEIIASWINPQTHNVNVIIDVFPEYQRIVKDGAIPQYVSPLVQFDEVDPKTGEMTKGRVIHLQSVDSPGYDKAVAKINGLCEGKLGQCLAELRVKGASSLLNGYQKQHRKFFNANYTTRRQMSANEIEEITKKVDGFGKIIDDKFATLKTELATMIKGGSAVVAESDPALDILNVKKSPASSKETPPSSAEKLSDADRLKKVEAELAEEKQKRETAETTMKEEKEKITSEKRMITAKEIAQYESQLRQINPKDIDKQAKMYFELKMENADVPQDLSLLHKKLSEQVKKIKGAFGEDILLASLETPPNEAKPIDYMALHNKFGGRR